MMMQEEVTSQVNTPVIKTKQGWRVFCIVLCSLLMVFAVLLFFSALWYTRHYGATGFDSVLFTLFSNLRGTNGGLINSFLLESILPAVFCSGVLIFILFILKIKRNRLCGVRFWHKAAVSLLVSLVFLFCAGTKVNIFGYIQKMMLQTTLYEDHFVKPSDDLIHFPEEKRNLIYILLESMEPSYMSASEGGALAENAMPELTRLAEENVNFSHNEGVGGFFTPTGTGWTVAGMVAQSSGVPLKGSSGVLENNEYGRDTFLPGVISLSDILNKNGYKQALMVGSDASFANRKVYYSQHKTDFIYDLVTAKAEGVVPEDYHVWWGIEDELVYQYAKDKIIEMARENEPFAFTLLTADTHFPEGYVCKKCRSNFSEQYENVIACSSHQVWDFVNWIKKQAFYNNTTIVICGDHLSMDYQYVQRNISKEYVRTVYNCFINPAVTSENTRNRTFTSLDIFPTILAAMGCEISGDRLGLGTNVFSGRQTLAEEMGYEQFNHELLHSSKYYIKEFMVD